MNETKYRYIPCCAGIEIDGIVFHGLQEGPQIILGSLCIVENIATLLIVDPRNPVPLG